MKLREIRRKIISLIDAIFLSEQPREINEDTFNE